jgi:hypothetical protein
MDPRCQAAPFYYRRRLAHTGPRLETFHVDSWLEHMRQHQRVTNADRVLQDAVHSFHAEGTPAVRHLIAAQGSANG